MEDAMDRIINWEAGESNTIRFYELNLRSGDAMTCFIPSLFVLSVAIFQPGVLDEGTQHSDIFNGVLALAMHIRTVMELKAQINGSTYILKSLKIVSM